MMEKVKKAKKLLEDYLSLKSKDFASMDEKTAKVTMSIHTFTIWRSWRDLQDVCEGNLR